VRACVRALSHTNPSASQDVNAKKIFLTEVYSYKICTLLVLFTYFKIYLKAYDLIRCFHA
jgi:hypothetical protein